MKSRKSRKSRSGKSATTPAGGSIRRTWRPLTHIPDAYDLIAGVHVNSLMRERCPFAVLPADSHAALHSRPGYTVEWWINGIYGVDAFRDRDGDIRCLAIVPPKGGRRHDFTDLQQIKTELAGPDAEAFEIYPPEDHLTDLSDMYWLFVSKPGNRLGAGLYRMAVPTLNGKQGYFPKPFTDWDIPEGCSEITRQVFGEPPPPGVSFVDAAGRRIRTPRRATERTGISESGTSPAGQ